jgi:hypothetical protein
VRTTLTLDDDVAERLKALAHRQRISFKEVTNCTLRRGLSAQERRRRKRFQVVPFRSPFRPGVDALRLNQLADELEIQSLAPRR